MFPSRLLEIKHSIINILLMMLLAGCASHPSWPEFDQQESALHSRTVLEQVPFYPQARYQCGPASLAMMLNSQGLKTDPEQLRDLVYLPGRKGSLQVELVAAARAHQLLVYPLDRRIDSLLLEVAAGHPVLVMQNLAFNWWPQWHFAVVIGFDPQTQTVILHSGTRERHEIPIKVFERTWSRAGSWATVMLPPDQLPATAESIRYLQAANDLETTGQLVAAMRAYQTAEQRWPDQPAALLGQGNVAYAQQDAAQAAREFAKMAKRFPTQAVAWNNLAHTLAELGCARQASAARQCAAALAPERFPDNSAASTVSGSSVCPLPACPVPPAGQ